MYKALHVELGISKKYYIINCGLCKQDLFVKVYNIFKTKSITLIWSNIF